MKRTWLAAALPAALAVVGSASATGHSTPAPSAPRAPAAHEADPSPEFAVPPPPFTDGIFPCSECHESMPVNMERRELTDEHTNVVLHHGPRERWCFDCHNPTDRDHLRLASGTLVPFTESWRLCGQCHGDKLRDWKVGVHGKRTGEWSGQKRYLLCAHCHDPHSPHFKPLAPRPAPKRPLEAAGR